MAIKYEVKKVVFGFDKTNTEKFVAQTKVLGLVKFDKLCEEVQKVSMAPRGVVKMVIDGLIDTLNMDLDKGYSVQLGDFGCFRPGLNAKSQAEREMWMLIRYIVEKSFSIREAILRICLVRQVWKGWSLVRGLWLKIRS
jgi:predicted histone-like DNA-binding protein